VGPLDPQMRRVLEAVLFAAEEPVDANTLAQVLEVPTGDVLIALADLRRQYVDEGRGFVLREAGGGWRLYTDPNVAPYVERFVLAGRTARLSQAALETLAIVAYKQPVTRHQVEAIRGVNTEGVLRALVDRGLLAEVGREEGPGRPVLYGTTPEFLERLGLNSITDLPPLAPLLGEGEDTDRREADEDAEADRADGAS
jgi:segregation and condensation protein B